LNTQIPFHFCTFQVQYSDSATPEQNSFNLSMRALSLWPLILTVIVRLARWKKAIHCKTPFS